MNFDANWELKIEPDVYKQAKRFPPTDRERVFSAINSLSLDPYVGDIEKIGGESDVWRRRVGAYRVFFEVYQHSRKVNVFRVKRRGSNTY